MNSTPDEEIGSRLQQVREGRNLSQAQALRALRAAGLVWSQGTLSKVESGLRPLRLAELPPLARAYGVNQSELMAAENPVRSALERIRVAEQTTQDAYIDLQRRYMSTAATRRSIQLIAELAEGLAGPYTVSCSSARFMEDALKDEFSEISLSGADAMEVLGIPDVEVDMEVKTWEDWIALTEPLPEDCRLSIPREFESSLTEGRINSGPLAGTEIDIVRGLGGLNHYLTAQARGKALEAKFPQVTFVPAKVDEDSSWSFWEVKQQLTITGLRETEDA
ncbi:helix-turn-helix domain-containing protein [Arthrobacter sp. D5-1]|uniref:helix-turn-helix domain-containing protein n=1 Tax=Arthrobacter sp. D5-1 TaxID=1477518 RepID=UPI001A99366F|nr:helix-turn-helix domain-containing protein [Arthrobacter sp. D5-1]